MVVKTTPPASTRSFSRRSTPFCLRLWLPQQVLATRKGAEELVVKIVAVSENDNRRVRHRRLRIGTASVECHRQALARALRVPDHAMRRSPGLPPCRSTISGDRLGFS